MMRCHDSWHTGAIALHIWHPLVFIEFEKVRKTNTTNLGLVQQTDAKVRSKLVYILDQVWISPMELVGYV